ncbi:MAG: flagellar biosynthetic protein FliR [Proteocatella sp.]
MTDQSQLILWTLIMVRCTGVILLNPILGRRNVPGIVKSGFILALSLLVFTYDKKLSIEVAGFLEYALLLLKELAVGYIIGYVTQLFMYICIYAGGIIDFQMGLSMATIYDAQSNSSIPITGTVFNTLFVLIFFAVDGHLALIKLFMQSSEIIPYGQVVINAGIAPVILKIFIGCTVLAVKLAFPIIAIEFLTEMGVGILMKAIPQINVFVVNIQAKIIIGFIVLIFMFSPMASFVNNAVVAMIDTLREVITLI